MGGIGRCTFHAAEAAQGATPGGHGAPRTCAQRQAGDGGDKEGTPWRGPPGAVCGRHVSVPSGGTPLAAVGTAATSSVRRLVRVLTI